MSRSDGRAREDRPGSGRAARAQHSLEAILDTAIAILDRDGPSGLTFRGLAAELGGGVGSIYWYVSGKDELVSRAIDAVVGRALDDVRAMWEGTLDPRTIQADGDAPICDTPAVTEALTRVRRVLLATFRQLELHPWVAPQLQRGDGLQRNSLRLWDLVGQELMTIGLTPLEQFHGASALVNYVTGVGAEMAYRDIALGPEPRSHDEVMDDLIASWFNDENDDMPFVRSMVDVFRNHDDFAQFVGGLDLLLMGIGRQATRA